MGSTMKRSTVAEARASAARYTCVSLLARSSASRRTRARARRSFASLSITAMSLPPPDAGMGLGVGLFVDWALPLPLRVAVMLVLGRERGAIGNRESDAGGGECVGVDSAVVGGEAEENVDEDGERGGEAGGEADEGKTLDNVLVIVTMGMGSGPGMSLPRVLLEGVGAVGPKHISRIETRRLICSVKWGTSFSARAARSPSRVIALYACGSLCVAEAYA